MLIYLGTGAAPALMNYNLASEALIHCVKISGARILITDADEGCRARIQSVASRLESQFGVKILRLDPALETQVARQPCTPPDRSLIAQQKDKNKVALLYTRYLHLPRM